MLLLQLPLAFYLSISRSDAIQVSDQATMPGGEQRGPPRFLYGVVTGNFSWRRTGLADDLFKMVDAQRQTWEKNVPRERLIIVDGQHDDEIENLDNTTLVSACSDVTSYGLACKTGLLLSRAISRLHQGVEADWLFITEDDHYVMHENMKQQLSKFDPKKPQVLTSGFGCGRGREPVSQFFSCQAVYIKGGICGGGGTFVSRAALEALRPKEWSHYEFINFYLKDLGSDEFGRRIRETMENQPDDAVSCLYHKLSIPIILVQDWQYLSPNANHFECCGTDDCTKKLSQFRAAFLVHITCADKYSIPDMIYALDKAVTSNTNTSLPTRINM